MSTIPTTSSSTSSNGLTSPMNLSGLVSGIDTNTIVQEMMSIEQQPEVKLKLQLSAEQARQSALQDVQTQLQTLQSDEQALQDPGLWAPTQSVTTSDATKMSAVLTGGSGPGGYQISVSQLALAAQRTYTYTSPSAADTLTIGSTQITIPAGSDINAAAAAINSAQGSPVYAVVIQDPSNSSQQDLVLASRSTGAASTFTASDSTGSFSEITADAVAGQDALYTVNNGAQRSSASNVVTNAIPGVQLTLSATTSSPVTVNVTAPAVNESAVQSAVQAFVTQYNNTITDIQGKLTQAPVANPQNATDAAQGVLYGDMGLSELLNQLRESFSQTFSTGNTSYQQLFQIGISTGAAVGSGGLNQNSINGQISFDTTTFSQALAANPTAVQALLGGSLSGNGFAQAFDALLQPQVGPGGVLSSRISDETQVEGEINNQISDMQARLQVEQTMLQQQFANMETLMQSSQAQGNWLTGQIATLPTTTSTSSTGTSSTG